MLPYLTVLLQVLTLTRDLLYQHLGVSPPQPAAAAAAAAPPFTPAARPQSYAMSAATDMDSPAQAAATPGGSVALARLSERSGTNEAAATAGDDDDRSFFRDAVFAGQPKVAAVDAPVPDARAQLLETHSQPARHALADDAFDSAALTAEEDNDAL